MITPRQVFIGASIARAVDTRGPQRRSFPDVDINGVQWDTGLEGLKGAVAISLNEETDWDAVRVYFSSSAPAVLTVGGLVLVPQGEQVRRIEPLIPAPTTRLYDGTNVRNNVLTPPQPAAGIQFQALGDGGDFVNNTAAAVALYKWSGTAWVFSHNVAAAGIDGTIVSNGALHNRPADYSLDQQWTLADLILAGFIFDPGGHPVNVPQIASEFALDAHGNAGDPTQPSTKLYPVPTNGNVRFGDLSPLFYGRLALDVWQQECTPRRAASLPPMRYVSLGATGVLATPGYPTAPDQALLTFPVGNAKRVEFLFHNNGPGNITFAIVSPAPTDLITSVAGVNDSDDGGPTYSTIAAGADGSFVLEDPAHPYCKILVGGDNNANVIAAGAILTIKRETVR